MSGWRKRQIMEIDMINKDTLKQQLRESVKTITFTKTDGTQRVMKCTLQSTVIPPADPDKAPSARKTSDEALAVWDVDAAGWRSFRYDAIISVQ